MTSVDRTAYPHFNKSLSQKELASCYALSDDELTFIRQNTRSQHSQLNLAIRLKTRQHLGYFITLSQIPFSVIQFIATQLNLPENSRLIPERRDRKATHRYKILSRQYLDSHFFTQQARQNIVSLIHQSAYTMSDPADLINVALEYLSKKNIELPVFSTLERLASHERQLVHNELYLQITQSLTKPQKNTLDSLLLIKEGELTTRFSWVKQTPGPATLQHFRLWADRLALWGFG
ncbi:DUF4158 domain-containing protein [Photorhabdus bodei]|uniref:DUF4158 domain-containing protein n=1 Tax=Photorhabdus bodei TaxID=2029681 RepID=A0A329WSF0_9GAMM|nr:DUF4158 domain-containing protein [Photorhabdus bodei]RAX07471.1 hypothetical protein CKY02_20890 [Photorhabdus bodei]